MTDTLDELSYNNLTMHPSVIAAGNEAMGLWLRAAAWSTTHDTANAHTTHGVKPKRVVYQLGTRRACDRFVQHGRFTETELDYTLNDVTQHKSRTANR